MNTNSSILITGGTGFVGSHLVEELQSKGFQNVFVTNYSPNAGYVGTLIPSSNIKTVDLTDREQTFGLLRELQPDYIFHLASIAVVGDSFEKAAKIFQNNTSLQLNLLDAIKEVSSNSRLLVVGSGAEYGIIDDKKFPIHSAEFKIDEDFPLNPSNPYAVSKVTQDLLALSYVHSYDLDIVRARPFNHIGERQTRDFAIPAFAEQIVKIEQGEQDKIYVGNLEAIRDFTDVKDVVKAYLVLMEKGQQGEVYNVGSGKGYTMKEILDSMVNYSSAKIEVEIDPNRVRPIDVPVVIADNAKIKELGWQPEIEIEDTLKRIIDEWRNK